MSYSDEQIQSVRRLIANQEAYSAHCLKVLSKEGNLVPFIWNKAQRYIHAKLEQQLQQKGYIRALILKGRQQGCSTLIAARYYNKTSTSFGKRAFIVSHEEKSTQNLFAMVKRYDDHNPLSPSKKASNAQELVFGKLDSGYKLATAGSKDVGRGNTAQLLHGCLGAGALVMMADGSLRAIESLEPGDMVRTRRGFEAPVKGISWHRDSTREIRIAMNGLRLRATDSHKFWTQRGMVQLADLRIGDRLGFPVREITEEISVVKFSSDPAKRLQGGGRKEVTGPGFVPLTFELGRVLGLYLAEGHLHLQSKFPHAPASVIFACHERELSRNTSWIREVEGFSSLSESGNKGSKTRMTNVYGRQFASFVMRMCGRNGDKHLPHEWWKMPREFVRGMLIGYLAGDGHCSPSRDRRIQAPSVVPAIAYGMRDVVAALGYGFPSVSLREAATRNGRNEKAQYILRITGAAVDVIAPMLGWNMPERKRNVRDGRIQDGYAWLEIESIGKPFDEMVWDIEVDHPDHDYCLTQCATSNSEFGFWQNAQSHLAGIGNSIPLAPGTEIILESTANGLGNAFHEMWQNAEAGIGEYMAIFVPWMWQDEYRLPVPPGFVMDDDEAKYAAAYGCDAEQMVWRRAKLLEYGKGSEWLFDQEYPATPSLAFRSSTKNPLINPGDVNAAVQSKLKPDHAPLIIGCDPAGDGAENADRTAIAFRRGRVCLRVEYHSELDTMAIASKLAGYFNEFSPDAIFIDKTGLGTGVYDRLRQLNVPCVGVNNAERARDPTKYENKRAEMWWTMKQWFEDAPCRIPNDAALIADVCAPQPAEERDGHKLLESKKDMKKRGIRSPDGGDALALTFAEPVSFRIANTTSSGWSTPSNAGY